MTLHCVKQPLSTEDLRPESSFAASLTKLSSRGSSVRTAHLVGFQLVCKVLHLLLILEKLVRKHTELGYGLLLPDIRLQHATVQHLLVALQQPACRKLQMFDGKSNAMCSAGSSEAPGSG